MSIKQIITVNGSPPNKLIDRRFIFLNLYAEYCHIPVQQVKSHPLVFYGPLGTYSLLVDNKQVIIDFSDISCEGLSKDIINGTIPYTSSNIKLSPVQSQQRNKRIVNPARSSMGKIDPNPTFEQLLQSQKNRIVPQVSKFNIPVIKMHYYPQDVASWQHVYPGGSWLDLFTIENMKYFFQLCEQNIYTCNNNIILNNQNAHSRALQRRKHVQDILKRNYGDLADCSYQFENQKYFWDKFKNCLVSVVVGGARSDMCDRGLMEQMGLGVCMIFSGHSDLFAGRHKLLPWKEYIPVYSDYSNLVERIEWCKSHRDECRIIGRNARQFFLNYCQPSKYLEHIENIIESHYGNK